MREARSCKLPPLPGPLPLGERGFLYFEFSPEEEDEPEAFTLANRPAPRPCHFADKRSGVTVDEAVLR